MKTPARPQIIGNLRQMAIRSGDRKTIQLWSEYDEMKKLGKEGAHYTNFNQKIGLEHLRIDLVKATTNLYETQNKTFH